MSAPVDALGGVDALLALLDDLRARVARLEAAQASLAVEVVTRKVTVQDPADEGPSVVLAARSGYGQVHVAGGRRHGPHINLEVREDDGDVAGVYLYGAEDERGAELEAWWHRAPSWAATGSRAAGRLAFWHRGERGPAERQRSTVLDDHLHATGATFGAGPGQGSVTMRGGDLYGELSVQAADSDHAPQVTIYAGLEGVTALGRDLGQGYVMVRHDNADVAELGCQAPAGVPGRGQLTIRSAVDDRIRLRVDEDDQAVVEVGSDRRHRVSIDAGRQGAGVSLSDGSSTEMVLDASRLRRP